MKRFIFASLCALSLTAAVAGTLDKKSKAKKEPVKKEQCCQKPTNCCPGKCCH